MERPTEQLHVVVEGVLENQCEEATKEMGRGLWGGESHGGWKGRHGKSFRNGSYTQLWHRLGNLTGGKMEPAWEELSVLGETGEISPPSHMHAHVYTHMLIQVLMTHKDNCLFFYIVFSFYLKVKAH